MPWYLWILVGVVIGFPAGFYYLNWGLNKLIEGGSKKRKKQ